MNIQSYKNSQSLRPNFSHIKNSVEFRNVNHVIFKKNSKPNSKKKDDRELKPTIKLEFYASQLNLKSEQWLAIINECRKKIKPNYTNEQ